MLNALCRRMSFRMSSAGWSALMYSVRLSATMCAFRWARMWFCVISAPEAALRDGELPEPVGAGVVDDDDFISGSSLGKQRMETGGKDGGFVVGANDNRDRRTHLGPVDTTGAIGRSRAPHTKHDNRKT